MNVQIEVTTRCNFDCFYCAGRNMVQQDMSMEQYQSIMESHVRLYGAPPFVSLQGEGEPTLNKAFFGMAAHVRSLGSEPYTITNGTYKYPEHFAKDFSRIGVSIDTLDPVEATQIGRHNLMRILKFIDDVVQFLDVTIYTVALSPSCLAVAEWCRQRGLKHVMQPLQPKQDYQYLYPERVFMHHRPTRYQCDFLSRDLLRYYSVEGKEFPCCFIKDASSYLSIAALQQELSKQQVPSSCIGCRSLK